VLLLPLLLTRLASSSVRLRERKRKKERKQTKQTTKKRRKKKWPSGHSESPLTPSADQLHASELPSEHPHGLLDRHCHCHCR